MAQGSRGSGAIALSMASHARRSSGSHRLTGKRTATPGRAGDPVAYIPSPRNIKTSVKMGKVQLFCPRCRKLCPDMIAVQSCDCDNPYQSPLPDGFLDDTVQGYEESLRTHERTITGLRDRIAELEAENERLKWQLVGGPAFPLVIMEGADID